LSSDRKTQVHHPIHVIAVGDEVVPQRRRIMFQNRADGRDVLVCSDSGDGSACEFTRPSVCLAV
jgi:hypothetical protein